MFDISISIWGLGAVFVEIISKIVRKLSIQGFQFFDRYNIDLNLATDITILKMAIKSIILKLNQH